MGEGRGGEGKAGSLTFQSNIPFFKFPVIVILLKIVLV